MPNNFHGSFVFQNAGNLILHGIYINNEIDKPFLESANQVTNLDPTDVFIGVFDTVWLEANGDTIKAKLNITKVNFKYELKWTNLNVKHNGYEGLGMIHNGDLVGCYWKVNSKTLFGCPNSI